MVYYICACLFVAAVFLENYRANNLRWLSSLRFAIPTMAPALRTSSSCPSLSQPIDATIRSAQWQAPESELEAPGMPMVQQEDDYPGTPSSLHSGNVSLLSDDATDYDKRVTFNIVFVTGASITRVANYLSSVGWAVKEAADYLGVPANRIRLLRGVTILTSLHVKLFDALDTTNRLSVVVVSM